MSEIRVERTGNYGQWASKEFLATFPDGTTETLWSPLDHEYTIAQEEAKALEFAKYLWETKQHATNEPTSWMDD